MQVSIRDNDIRIQTDKETAVSLGARYIKGNTYQLPKNIHAVRDLYKITRDIDLLALGKSMKQKQSDLLELKILEDVEMPGFKKLRPYQRADVNFLSKLPHAGVFSQQRTGKSPTSLSVFEAEGRKKNCIVCPASLVINWSKEVEAWTNKTPFPVKGSKKQREKIYDSFRKSEEGYLIISYETLRSDIEIVETL